MSRIPARLTRALRALAFPTAGAICGISLCALIAAQVHTMSPHAALLARAPDRLYVTMDCSFSQQALDLLVIRPGAREVVTIAADLAPTPARGELCRQSLDLLRARDSLWWSVLPERYVCGRLAAEARAWMTDQAGDAAQVPAWVVDGALVGLGVDDETLAALERHQLLADLEFSSSPEGPSTALW